MHVSSLGYQKNPLQVLEALAIVKLKTRQAFRMILVGEPASELRQKAKTLGIEDCIEFKGFCPQPVLAAEMRQCHCLVLYSRYETFGCVVAEALTAGLPVIASDLPVMHELVLEAVNGIFTPLDNPGALAEAMLWMMEHWAGFDRNSIMKIARDRFDLSVVARQFDVLYENMASGR